MLGDTKTEGAAAEAGMLPPDHPDYKPQAGWQVMILPAACKEMFSKKKGVEDEDLFQKYPVPEEMSSLAPAALATLLPRHISSALPLSQLLPQHCCSRFFAQALPRLTATPTGPLPTGCDSWQRAACWAMTATPSIHPQHSPCWMRLCSWTKQGFMLRTAK